MTNLKHLNLWVWKWHCIAGLIVLPFFILLAITGSIYLFKQDYEQSAYSHIREVTPQGSAISYQQQWAIAQENSSQTLSELILPDRSSSYDSSQTEVSSLATQFKAGRFSKSSYVFVDPYSATVTGSYAVKDTLMQKVRKLHGELLLGKWGTHVIELVASWIVVMVVTGLFLWWPKQGFKGYGLVRIRWNQGTRTRYRDLHALVGFWTSALILAILAGGLPWTEVVGGNFKTLRDSTQTGYPSHWHNSKGLESQQIGTPLTLDQMVAKAQTLDLKGTVTIKLPQSEGAVFSVTNRAPQLHSQQVYHFDQYSGQLIKHLTWADVGALSHGRQIVMRFHQGELFGPANWWLILITALLLAGLAIVGAASYLARKPKNQWAIPQAPEGFKVSFGVIAIILVLSLLLPLFGASVLAILLGHWLHHLWQRRLLQNPAS